MSDFHPLTVSEIKNLTPKSVMITFDVPLELRETYQFKAGQYITIKHVINGKEVRRAYSICCSTKSNCLQVGVKKVTDGAFSVFATTILKIGDTLEVMSPKGNFVLDPQASQSKNYLAFAAGSGITPILSMARTALEFEKESTFVLVYGNQFRSETMFYDEIQELKSRFSERFDVTYIYSREHIDTAKFGRIDRALVNYILKNKFSERVFDAFYLCGPDTMIEEVSNVLKESGKNDATIHFELFTSENEEPKGELSDGSTQVTVTLDDEELSFVMSQNKSVLEAALGQKIDAPFSCQGGICSTCIARITEGKAEMRKNQILTDEEIEEGLILTCQAHPTTATLGIDYDDV